MTSYQKKSKLFSPNDNSPLSPGILAYFRERLINRLYALVIEEFWIQKEKHGLTQRELAERIRKDTGQVSRLLGAPGNWTLDTVSDLMIGMGCEPSLGVKRLKHESVNTDADQGRPTWLDEGNNVLPFRTNQSATQKLVGNWGSDILDTDSKNTNAV